MSEETKKVVKVECDECGGGPRNHEVLVEHEESGEHPEAPIWWKWTYQICKCRGCDTVRFRRVHLFSEHIDYANDDPNEKVDVFPELRPGERQPMEFAELPAKVASIYRETIKALNAGALTLAGGGLRAIVEAICIHQQVQGKTLQARIDALAAQGLLAKQQAELLHEERYIGNSALHEIERPSQQDVEDGLQIVEALLNTIYIAPFHAARLRKQRLGRSGDNPALG